MSKDILIELLKKSLDEKLKYIENRTDDHMNVLQHTKDEFDKFTNVIDNLVKLRKEREIAELQENEKKEKEKTEKGNKEDKTKKEDKKKSDKTNTKSNNAMSNKKTLKPAQSSANIITQKPAKNTKTNLTIETNSNNNKGKRTQTPGGGKRTKTEPSNVSRHTMPVSSARGSVQGGTKSGGNNNTRSNSKPSTKKTTTSKGKGDKTSASKGHSDKNVSTPSSSSMKNKSEKASTTTTTTTTKFQPIIESKEETTVNDVSITKQEEQKQNEPSLKVIETKPKTLLEMIQEKLIISEHIFPYLNEEDKMNLIFTNKKLFIRNLQEVFKLKRESKLKSLNVLIGQTIDDKIDELKNVSTYTLYIYKQSS